LNRLLLALACITLLVGAEPAPAPQQAAPWPQWVTWIIALGFGGVGGACLTAIVVWWRGQKQPIYYRIDSGFSFNQVPETSEIQAVVAILHPESKDPYPCDNLIIVDVDFINRSGKDYPTFRAAITLSDDNVAIHGEAVTRIEVTT